MFRAGVLDLKPKRPYRSLAEYRGKVIWLSSGAEAFFKENPTKWPCLECSGTGRIYDPQDPPDIIEGNKLRNVIKCPKCGGTRCSHRSVFAEAYQKAIKEYLKKKREWEDRRALCRSGIRKLTKPEREALGL